MKKGGAVVGSYSVVAACGPGGARGVGVVQIQVNRHARTTWTRKSPWSARHIWDGERVRRGKYLSTGLTRTGTHDNHSGDSDPEV